MKSKVSYFLLAVGLILSILFFSLKCHKYFQRNTEAELVQTEYVQSLLKEDVGPGWQREIKDISYYENLFKSKDIFKFLLKEKNSLQQDKPGTEVDLYEAVSKFELLGIVSAEGRSQALIRNIENGRTFYCTGGEKVNGFVVVEVLADKVILEQEGKRVELKL